MKKILFALLLVISNSVLSGQNPISVAQDHRVKIVPYDENNIVQLKCHYDLQTMIEYASHERILSMNSGQSTSWDITFSQSRPYLLKIRPMARNADTNLTVVTDKRIYLYELKAREQWNMRSPDITFMVRYRYPDEIRRVMEGRALAALKQEENEKQSDLEEQRKKEASKINPSELNMEYTFGGDKSIAPITVFDDGTFTYFKFDKNSDLPAIYVVDENRNESMVNRHMEGPYMVVEQLGNRFTLRSGKHTTTVLRGRKTIASSDSKDKSEDTTPRWW